MTLVTVGVDRVRTWVRSDASTLSCLMYTLAMLCAAFVWRSLPLAVYTLSFWHYYLYWLAYRQGAAPIATFKRDAVLTKGVALALLAAAYLSQPIAPLSLTIVLSGFGLNALAARVLGADRTYYGYELGAVPAQRVTAFPYSYVSHPMLVGNIAAYAGTLLSAEFRQAWWPLACAHLTLNAGLLLMEVWIEPLGTRRLRQATRSGGGTLAIGVAASIAAGTALMAITLSSAEGGPVATAIVAVCSAAHGRFLYRCYTSTR